jgi:regulator of sigma E protease
MTLLAFLLALGILITVHEWGHYRVALACGVKVITFSIGFGKPLLRWSGARSHAGQSTEFVIGLIPLGGYVKMLDERESPVPPGEQHMAFNRQPLWARTAIVAAGPLANLLLAVVLYAATFWLGQYETQATLAAPVAGSVAEVAGLRSGDTVLRAGSSPDDLQAVTSLEDLRWWTLQHGASSIFLEVQSSSAKTTKLLHLPDMTEAGSEDTTDDAWVSRGFTGAWSRAVLADVIAGGAAAEAGLQAGDEVLSIDGRQVPDATTLRAWVQASGRQQVPVSQVWTVARRGAGVLQVTVVPKQVQDGPQKRGRIEAKVGEPPVQIWVQLGAWDGLAQGFNKTSDVIRMTLEMLGRLLVGQASLDNLSGPLSMADYAGRSASLGLGAFLAYLALVSVSLGVFNLLPLPVLDGGNLLYYLYEALTGRAPSTQWLDALQRVGLAVLVALMVFSLFNDVVRLGWLP